MAKSYYYPKRKFRNIEPPHADDKRNYSNPLVDMYVGQIEVDYTGFVTDNVIRQKAKITEDELFRGFVPPNNHLEKSRPNFLFGLAQGMRYPMECNTIKPRHYDGDLTVGDLAYANRLTAKRSGSGVAWDLAERNKLRR